MFKSNTFKHIPCPNGTHCRMGNTCLFNHNQGVIELINGNGGVKSSLNLEIDIDSIFAKAKAKINSTNLHSTATIDSMHIDKKIVNAAVDVKNNKPTASNLKSKSIESNSEKILKTKQLQASNIKTTNPTTTTNAATNRTITLPPKKQMLAQQESVAPVSTPITPQVPTNDIQQDLLITKNTPLKLKTSICNPALKNVLSKAPSKDITDLLTKENSYDNAKWIQLGIDPSLLPTIVAESRTKVPKSVRQIMLYYIIERCIDKTPSRLKAIEEGSKIEEIIYADSLSKNVYLNLISMELPKLLTTLESNYQNV